MLPTITNTRTFCNILHELTNKNYSVETSTIFLLEEAIVSTRLELNLKDFHHLLIFLNNHTIYSRLSSMFWENFTRKIQKELQRENNKWPVGIVLSYISQEGYFVSSLYQYLIPKWMKEIENDSNEKVFREGFSAICNSNFITDDLISWSLKYFLKMRNFDEYDVLQIARALTIKNIYLKDFWEPLIRKIEKMDPKSLNDKSKLILYHIYKSIQIDEPEDYKSMLLRLNHLLNDIYSSYREKISFIRSYSQQYVARALYVHGYEFEENKYISEIYEIDLVLANLKIGIEVVGKPYHVSQITNDIYPKLRMKLRHLNKLGWKIILIRDKEYAHEQIKKLITFLEVIDTPTSIYFVNNEIKII